VTVKDQQRHRGSCQFKNSTGLSREQLKERHHRALAKLLIEPSNAERSIEKRRQNLGLLVRQNREAGILDARTYRPHIG